MKSLIKFQSSRGFGLTEVMITGALLGGLVLVSMHVSKMGNQGIQKVSRENSIINIHQEVLGEITDPSSCEKSLFSSGATVPLSSFTGTAQKDLTSIKNKDGFEAFRVSPKDGTIKDSVRVQRVYLTGYNSTTQIAQLKFEYSFTSSDNKVTSKTKATNVTIVPDSSKTNAQSCMLKSVASDFADYTSPSVTIDRAPTQADPTSSAPIVFNVVFSEAINLSTFITTDITQTGTATVSGWNIVNSGDNKTFTLTATGISVSGTVIPTLTAGKVQDLAGNDNIASTGTNKSVTFLWPAKLEWISPANNYSFGTRGYDSTAIAFTLKNTGEMSTSSFSVISSGSFGPFSITSNGCLSITLGPSGQCVVSVSLLAGSSGMAPGTYSGGLTTTSNPAGTPIINFSGAIAAGSLAWNTTSPNPLNPHNYGSYYSTSSTFTYVLTNSGAGYTGTISTSQSGTIARWEKLTDNCQGIRLAPGGNCTIQMRFKGDYANGVGSFSSSLTASSSNGGTVTYNLSGTVIYPPANLAFVTKPADPEYFGSTYSNVTRQYTVINNSDGPSSSINVQWSFSNDLAWGIGTETTACQGKSLAAKGTCTITVTFKAASIPIGNYDAKIGFDASNGGSDVFYPSGIVVSPPPPPSQLSWGKEFDMAYYSYGVQPLNTEFVFTLTNVGEGTNYKGEIYFDNYDPAFWDFKTDCGTVALKPLESCSVSVYFLGESGPDPSYQKAVIVAVGENNKTYIMLDGTKPEPGLIAWYEGYSSPQSFGKASYNVTKSWIITNRGKGPITGISTLVESKYPSAWVVSHNCPAALNPAATCSINTTFLAGSAPEGDHSAGININTGNNSGKLSITVVGTCYAAYWAATDTYNTEAFYDLKLRTLPTSGTRCSLTPGGYEVYIAIAPDGTQHQYDKDATISCILGYTGYSTTYKSLYIKDCGSTVTWSPRTPVKSVWDGCRKSLSTQPAWVALNSTTLYCDYENIYVTKTYYCR